MVGLHAFLLAASQEMWLNDTYVLGMLSAWIMLGPVVMVCTLALAMSICSAAESASQFAIYMSVTNMGYVTGSIIYGALSETATWSQNYAINGLLAIVLLMAIMAYRVEHAHPDSSVPALKNQTS